MLNVHDDHVVRIDEPNPNCLTLLSTSGLTSAIGLSESARIMPGETVLITAAAGGLGHLAAQWAMLKGCRVIGLTSTAQKAEYLNGLHLERVINYRTEDLSQVLTAEYPVSKYNIIHIIHCFLGECFKFMSFECVVI